MRLNSTLIMMCLSMILYQIDGLAGPNLQYIINNGQWNDDFYFMAYSGEGNIRLNSSSITFEVNDIETVHQRAHELLAQEEYQSHVWTMHFLNANRVVPEAIHPADTKYHFYIGNVKEQWKTNVTAYTKVIYKNLYDGIDLLVYSANGNFKYDFKLHPGANPDQIKWNYTGISPELTSEGQLIFRTAWKSFTENSPVSYQMDGSTIQTVATNYLKYIDDSYGFQLGSFDPRKKLTIDPEIIFKTLVSVNWHLCSYSHPNIGSLSADSNGDYLPTDGAYASSTTTFHSRLTKLDTNGTEIEWVAIIGGTNGINQSFQLTYDQGIFYSVGRTTSSDLPVLSSAFDSTALSNTFLSLFLFSLSEDGSNLISSTYYDGVGGPGLNREFGLNPLDPHLGGNFYLSIDLYEDNLIIGASEKERGPLHDTYPYQTNFSLTGISAEFDRSLMVFSIKKNLSEVNWIHLINSSPVPEDIEIDVSGNNQLRDDYLADLEVLRNGTIAVVGYSRQSTMPTSPDSFQPEWGEETSDSLSQDGWIGILNADNGTLLQSSYFGGSQPDDLRMVIEGADGDLVVIGRTLSPELEPINAGLHVGHGRPRRNQGSC